MADSEGVIKILNNWVMEQKSAVDMEDAAFVSSKMTGGEQDAPPDHTDGDEMDSITLTPGRTPKGRMTAIENQRQKLLRSLCRRLIPLNSQRRYNRLAQCALSWRVPGPG